MSVNTTSSVSPQGLAQLQRQQAVRSAQLLEAKAEALAGQAQNARREADGAVQRADELESTAGVARSSADTARRSVQGAAGLESAKVTIAQQAERVGESLQAANSGTEVATPANKNEKNTALASTEPVTFVRFAPITYSPATTTTTGTGSSSNVGAFLDVAA